jgi:1,4-dihydroxy-2-naphthoate polyprenyltransferase
VLLILSHPRTGSFNHAVAEAVTRGLRREGAEVSVHDLYAEGFDPVLRELLANAASVETISLQAELLWAQTLIIVTPMWWASFPAMLKGYLDRVLTEDYAFAYNEAGIPTGRLHGRNALVLVTTDTPRPILYATGRIRGLQGLLRGALEFCGISPSRFRLIGPVRGSSVDARERWLAAVEALAARAGAAGGARERLVTVARTLVAAVRLPLFSFVFASVLLGAAVGAAIGGAFRLVGLLAAEVIGFLGHAAVSLANEAADADTDLANRNRTPFSGGTGLLAGGLVSPGLLTAGWIVAAALAVAGGAVAMALGAHWILAAGMACALGLGLQYSLRPLRLSRIGLGELSALVAYGAPLMAVGLALQADRAAIDAALRHPALLLLALPISLSVFTTLCLTQIPDVEADRVSGKRSIAVNLGPRAVLLVAAAASAGAAASLVALGASHAFALPAALAAALVPAANAAFIFASRGALTRPAGGRLTTLMSASATTGVLCGVIPAIALLLGR